ncbi:MAG: amidohydrolase [Pseudomonadota bacterium]
MVRTRKTLLLLLLISSLGCTTSPQFADSVFLNGKIYAGNVENAWVQSVAIRDGRFIYVGDNPSDLVGPATQTYDLGNKLVIPGLIDGHTHPGLVALTHDQLLLDDASNKDELMAAIKKMVDENPDRSEIIGGFWENEIFDAFGPNKKDLDEIESERPLILYDAWAHTVWANSAALKQANVTKDTPDLVPGFAFYQKNETGEPTGWITESAASVFMNNFLKITPEVEVVLKEYLDYFRSVGVTTVFDAGNFGLDREVYGAVARLDKRGLLPVRYHGSYTLYVPNDYEDAIKRLKQLGADFNSENVRIDTLKVFFDGVLETRTAAISNDYLDTPGNSGEALLNQEQIRDLVLALDEENLNLHVHAVGDRAVTTVLDGIESAHQSLGRVPKIRMAICHLEVVKVTDFPRFKKLNVVGNFTPHWWVGGEASWVEKGIGDAVNQMQRAQSLISDGALVTFSSDNTSVYEWQTQRSDPFLGMQMGHNRQDIGVPANGPVMPPLSDRVPRADLVNGYTGNAAYQLGRSDELGTIAVGHRADLLVLNQNLFEVDRYDIHKTKPQAVIVDGVLVSGSL